MIFFNSNSHLFVILCLLLIVLISTLNIEATSRTTTSHILNSFPSSHRSRFTKVIQTNTPIPAKHAPRLKSSINNNQDPPPPTNSSSQSLPIIYPIDFGADPTGVNDSTEAIQKAISFMLNSYNHSHRLASGMIDLGGATIDLLGGDYLISAPLVIPPGYGNGKIMRGTIRASSKFPSNEFILTIGNASSAIKSLPKKSLHHSPTAPDAQDCWMENFLVSEMMFDGQQYALGCIRITDIMGAVLGNQNFYLGFTGFGIQVNGGHEVQIQNSWFGEYLYDSPKKETGNAIAIEVNGNDHVISNVVMFSSKIGIRIIGAANLIYNAHTWNDATGNGGLGIILGSPGYTQNRLVSCYLDFTDLLLVAPEHALVDESFFLGGASIILQSAANNFGVVGLVITNNMWDYHYGPNLPTIQLDETAGKFTSLVDTVIDNNMYSDGYIAVSTKLRTKLTQSSPSDHFNFNLSSSLLFPQFFPQYIQVSGLFNTTENVFIQIEPFTSRADNRYVSVRTSAVSGDKITGTVYLEIDQSTPSQHGAGMRRE